MIIINQKLMDVSQIGQGSLSKEKVKCAELMAKYSQVYEYETVEQFEFELEMRTQIIHSAVLLNKSGVKFATFQTSKCNEKYWHLTEKGAFVLKKGVLPQTGIADIFMNGNMYAFECATAIVIIFYKAVLETIDNQHFNRLFSDLYLYDWHYDQDLMLQIHRGTDFLPGDCVYFKNPEFNPETPYWQGENAIVIDHDLYYGHGIGIKTSQVILGFLNTKRKKNATESSFLMDQITRLNLHTLIQLKLTGLRAKYLIFPPICHSSNLIISEIGTKNYLL